MFTKPLTRHSIPTIDTSQDTDSISRLLVAAAINPRFCAALLADPRYTAQRGFGGEGFPLSSTALDVLGSVRATTLPEFATKLNEMLANSSRPS
jgi:hypothetical protein